MFGETASGPDAFRSEFIKTAEENWQKLTKAIAEYAEQYGIAGLIGSMFGGGGGGGTLSSSGTTTAVAGGGSGGGNGVVSGPGGGSGAVSNWLMTEGKEFLDQIQGRVTSAASDFVNGLLDEAAAMGLDVSTGQGLDSVPGLTAFRGPDIFSFETAADAKMGTVSGEVGDAINLIATNLPVALGAPAAASGVATSGITGLAASLAVGGIWVAGTAAAGAVGCGYAR